MNAGDGDLNPEPRALKLDRLARKFFNTVEIFK